MRLLKCDAYKDKVDCSLKDQIVQANPDIAGVGVSGHHCMARSMSSC